MGVMRSSNFWQLSLIASIVAGGEILVAFCPKHGLRSDLRVSNFSWGSMPPDPSSLFTLKSAHNGRTSLK